MVGYQPDSYLMWIVYALIVGLVTVAVTVVTFLIFDREETIAVWHRMLAFIKRGKKSS